MKTIFVVEEDDSTRSLLSELLTQQKDCAVRIFKDSQAAADALSEAGSAPDLLVADIETAAADGRPFAAFIREKFPGADVIALARRPRSALVREALGSGVAFVLPRPIDIAEFLDKVRRVLSRRERRAGAVEGVEADAVKDDWLELTAPSEMEYVERFRHFIEILYQTSLPDDFKRDLQIAISELGQNAVEWGNRGDSSKRLHLLYCVFEDRIMLKIEDEGEGFNLDALEDPTGQPLEYQRRRESQGKRAGGYGIFIVRNLMDQVIYNKKGNIVIMTKFLPKPRQAAGGGGRGRP